MKSMTGFGKGEYEFNGMLLTAELSGVNRKQFELRFSAPPEFAMYEAETRKLLSAAVSRGALQLRIGSSAPGACRSGAVDEALLDTLIAAAKAARKRNGQVTVVDVEALMRIPGVIRECAFETDDPGVEKAFMGAVENALANYQKMREREGEALKHDLETRLALLEKLLGEIIPLTAGVADSLKTKLLDKIARENLPVAADDERLLKEVLFYADKSDVTEEITRIRSHFGQFRGFLAQAAPAGRSLDFLMQELFREITTLGNKAGVAAISPLAVAFKSELEKLREQIQNVE